MKDISIKIGKIIGWSLLGILLFAFSLEIFGAWHDEWSGYNASMYVSDGTCNIAVIPVQGEVIGYETLYSEADSHDSVSPEDVRLALSRAESDPYIAGILTRLDSHGGSPVGGEAITDAFMQSSMPVVALVGDYAASSGYMIATGADTIIASPFSDIGSIGVTMSYLDMSKSNSDLGYEFVDLSSAPYKDYGNPDRPLTAQEKALLKRDLAIYHDAFVAMVAKNRDMPVEEVTKLADGSSMPANLALEAGLIDTIGNLATAKIWFAEQLGISEDEVVFCE